MTDSVLLATDGSPDAARAAGHAIAHAAQTGATLHAVFVVDTRDYGEPALSSVELLIAEYEDRGWDVLEAVELAAANHDVPVETRCCHGNPSEEILSVADAVDEDLIFVGKRGDTHEKLLGEVTRKLERKDERVVVAD